MKTSSLKTCVYDSAGLDNKQALSPPRGYQTQGISRCNPSAIPCASYGSTERRLGAPGEVAKVNTQNQEVL